MSMRRGYEKDWRWHCNSIRDWQNDVSINIYIPLCTKNKVAFSSKIGAKKDINKEKTLASSEELSGW